MEQHRREADEQDDDDRDDGISFALSANLRGRLGKHSEKAKWLVALVTLGISGSALYGLIVRILEALR